MSNSFLKESKLYIVYGGDGDKHRTFTSSALDFSQTFAQESYPVKTLHDQTKMLEGATITTANAVDFSFDVPLTKEKKESHVIDILTNLNTSQQLTKFDAYIVTGAATFKLENAIITAGDLDISPNSQFTVRLQGQATKLEKVGNESYTIPGTLQSVGTSRTPILVYPVVSINGTDVTNIISTTINIQNEITWLEYETLQKSLLVTNASNIMRPSDYVVEKRTVSGAVVQYQTDNNINNYDDFSTTTNIILKAIEVGDTASATPFLQIQLNPASYIARMAVGDVYTQSYDFNSLDNTALGTSITQYS